MNRLVRILFQVVLGLTLTTMFAGAALDTYNGNLSTGHEMFVFSFLGMMWVCFMGLIVVMLGD